MERDPVINKCFFSIAVFIYFLTNDKNVLFFILLKSIRVKRQLGHLKYARSKSLLNKIDISRIIY